MESHLVINKFIAHSIFSLLFILPLHIHAQTETPQDIEGQLEAEIQDFKNKEHTISFYIKDKKSGKRYKLNNKSESHLQNKIGQMVKISGTAHGNEFETEQLAYLSTEVTSTPTYAEVKSASTFGEQKTLVILVNFEDRPEEPYTKDHAYDVIFNQTSNFFLENSFGKAWLSGEVTGWYTIPASSTICDTRLIKEQANQAAIANGFDISVYDRLVYGFPQNACSFWGTASVGVYPSNALINGQFELEVTGHELGHNFGLYHAHSLVCESGMSVDKGGIEVLAATPQPACTSLEYGDGLDPMGWAPRGHFSAAMKEKLGWLGKDNAPVIEIASASGAYIIAPSETNSVDVKALKILKSPADQYGYRTWYYLEFRQAIGLDNILNNSTINMMDSDNIINGVIVHVVYEGNDGNNMYLVDMTPETNSDLYTRDPALATGHIFNDPDRAFSLEVISTDSLGALVNVNFATEPNPEPTPDTTAPDVVISSPTDGSFVTARATVAIEAIASDNDQVSKVEFYVNDVLICTDSSSKYSCAWKVPGGKVKNFSLEARAYDFAGNMNNNVIQVSTGNSTDGTSTGGKGKGKK